jgi:hypothetical protein
MFAKLWPAPQQPKRIETVWRELEGARVFEDGRFFVKRTARSVSSFAWGSRVMGLTLPFALDSIINPADHSYVGLAKEWNAEPNQPVGVRASLGLSGAIRSDPITLHTVMTTAESGAISITASTSHGAGQNMFSFTALPTGKSVYMEQFSGGEPAHGGMISVREEPAAVYGRGHRSIQHSERDWLNVDDRLGFAISGTGRIHVIPDARSQVAFLNDLPQNGSIAVIVTLPAATAPETREFASRSLRLQVKDPNVAAAVVDGFLVVTNFHEDPSRTEVEVGSRKFPFSINGITTRVFEETAKIQ